MVITITHQHLAIRTLHFLQQILNNPISNLHSNSTISSSQPSDCIRNDMGLSSYSNPADAGMLCVILVNTVISISMMKEMKLIWRNSEVKPHHSVTYPRVMPRNKNARFV
ncbi:hypothetical protein L1987_78345 [Smallanthus sonchifolius]|uniref:Uncharacterized protein n=1 Tax=Smallanthus sonchifolius TaxID=185202 RepID=A0ACB8ZDF3_9ASTR|nr:hypothetical protein L1987_78345 [Smallanthus sonchifolius]